MKSQSVISKPEPPANFWDQMDRLAGVNPDAYPNDEGLSVAEYAQRYRMSIAGADEKLKRLFRAGKVIVGKRRAANGNLMKVYRPK